MTSLVSGLLTLYNSVPTQWGGHEYLTPKAASDTSKDSIYDPDSGVTVGSLPDNYHPAVTTHSDLTGHAGYQNSVWGYNSHLLNNLQSINNICKANHREMPKNEDTPGSSYRGLLLSMVSTESGYGTTRSSVESEKEKVLCKYKYGPDHDQVFYEGAAEHLIHSNYLE